MNLSQQVLLLLKKDQSIRKEHWKDKTPENLEKMKDVDRKNRKELKKILQDYKYIGVEYGKEVQEAAFLLVQHLPKADISSMKKYLLQMKKHREDVSPNHIALLTDRIRSWEGKKQYYGTQFTYLNEEYILKPIWNVKDVDNRRKLLGLESLNEYLYSLEKERGISIRRKV